MSWPFSPLAPLSYDLIMADPPWRYKNWSAKGEHKNASAHYDCMDLDAIKALPVHQLAAPNCLLWLWATNPMLDQAVDVLKAWGFYVRDCRNLGEAIVDRVQAGVSGPDMSCAAPMNLS